MIYRVVGVLFFFASSLTFAAGPDFSVMLSSINFSPVSLAVLFVFASLVGVYVAYKGALIVLAAVSGRVFVHGRLYDADVYQSALEDLHARRKSGGLMDAESRHALERFEGRTSRRRSNRV